MHSPYPAGLALAVGLALTLCARGTAADYRAAVEAALKEPAAAGLGRPTPAQLAWSEMEVTAMVCLTPATWQGSEYDDGSTPLSNIDPEKLDTDQWVRAAKAFGAKQIVFVAKHVGGFCLWQTATTDYGVSKIPWRNGKGDVLGDLSASCRKAGLKLGVYVYPDDPRYQKGWGQAGRTDDPAKQEEYNALLRRQWTEVLSHYGEVSEVWFDGGCTVPLMDLLTRYAPHALIFGSPMATLRWVGNEEGVSPYPAWQTVPRAEAASGGSTALNSDPGAGAWLPMECDTPLLDHKWLWAPNTDGMIKPLAKLMSIYYDSVGRGSLLMLNITPDTSGLVPTSHMKAYEEFGREIQRRFGHAIAETRGVSKTIVLDLGKPTWVDHAITMEDIRGGQRVRKYLLEAEVAGKWQTVYATGSSIGYKKIDRFPPVEATKLRLTVTQSVGTPIVKRFAAFFVNMPWEAQIPVATVKASSEHGSGGYPASMMLDGDTSTRWGADDAVRGKPVWVEFGFGEEREIGRIAINEGWDRLRKFELKARVNGEWQTIYTGTTVGEKFEVRFDKPVRTTDLRWDILEATDLPTVWEFVIYPPPSETARVGPWQEVAKWTSPEIGGTWRALDFDLTKQVRDVGQYEVEIAKTEGDGTVEVQTGTALLEGIEAAQAVSRKADTNVFALSRSQALGDRGRTGLRVRLRTTGTCSGIVRIRRVM